MATGLRNPVSKFDLRTELVKEVSQYGMQNAINNDLKCMAVIMQIVLLIFVSSFYLKVKFQIVLPFWN